MIEVREIYGKPFKMAVTTKLLFLTNHLPRFRHGTDAERRRLRLLRFTQVPTEPDPERKAKIKAERNGILRLMVDYLVQLLKLNQLPFGGATSIATLDRFAATNDPVTSFIRQKCILDPEHFIAKDTLQEAFAAHLDEIGLPGALGDNFFKILYDRYPAVQDSRRRRSNGQRERIVTGITLK
jgi:phage/plasmid-associated DNA primase